MSARKRRKNINYLNMFNTDLPANLNQWDDPWPDRKNPVIPSRLRRGSGDGAQVWSQIQDIIRHPLAERQVWLFLGQILSKSAFEEHLSREEPTPEAVQAAFLLHATMTNVASVGAKLLVFCYP